MTLSPWSIGVFTSIDAGLGVHLDVAKELGIPSIQLHTPHAAGRTPAAAEAFLKKLMPMGLNSRASSVGLTEKATQTSQPWNEPSAWYLPRPALRGSRK